MNWKSILTNWLILALFGNVALVAGAFYGMQPCLDREAALRAELARVSSENCFLQLRIERYKEAGFLDELEST